MKFRLLYIEDQLPKTIQADLIEQGFDVDINDADNFENTLDQLSYSYDAYLMDFRLTANRGRVDAPTFASTLRTEGKNQKKKPIILITSEGYLSLFKNDFTSQDLFDFVVTKENFRRDIEKYSTRIKDLIDSYKLIETCSFDISKTLGVETLNDIDYRLLQKLNSFKEKNDVYGFCRLINYSLIRSIGLLIGDDILAARLGVDNSCEDFKKLKERLEKCRYTGVLSKSYNRWWADQIIEFWNTISDGKSLRRLKANERVVILNSALGLNLEAAKPIPKTISTNFWTICAKYLLPLDPSEGFVLMNKELENWQEQEYISLEAALEDPDLRAFLSPIDRSEISEFAKTK